MDAARRQLAGDILGRRAPLQVKGTMSKVVRFHAHGGPGAAAGSKSSMWGTLAPAKWNPGRSHRPQSRGGDVSCRGLSAARGCPRRSVMKASASSGALGSGVRASRQATDVCVLPNFRLGEYGLYAEKAHRRARSLIAPPPGLSVDRAASIWMQYFTRLRFTSGARGGRRRHPDPRRIEQRGSPPFSLPLGRGRTDATRTGAKSAAPQGAGRRIRDCHAGGEPRRGGTARHRRPGPCICSIRWAGRVETLAQACRRGGIIIIYGA